MILLIMDCPADFQSMVRSHLVLVRCRYFLQRSFSSTIEEDLFADITNTEQRELYQR